MAEVLLLPLAISLAFLFGWNNSSFLIGNLSGSGTLSTKGSILLTAIGLLAGVILGGQNMVRGLNGSLAIGVSDQGMMLTLLITVILTLSLTLLKLPVSFSMALVGGFLGAAYGSSDAINTGQVTVVISFWFLAPISTGGLTILIHTGVYRMTSNLSLITNDMINRTGVVISSIFVALSLGANNLGLIYGTVSTVSPVGNSFVAILTLAFFALLGISIFGKGGVSGTIGDRMLSLSPQGVLAAFVASAIMLFAGTQLRVPISISECLLGGTIGAAYTRKVTVINQRLFFENVSMMVVVPLVAFAAGFALVVIQPKFF
jgi:phosphate/sulfate permease